ncbi:glycerol kinase GlpK [Litorimonas sp. RW-G-Af-16]|uniref:glycerol kinase GlpK n=1 Tax=Litorimonas sp. RW-G-Af-16 TaxID=3241168 RepID=UPI00390CC440
MTQVILSIDQGTTSSRTLVFDRAGEILFTAQQEFPQIYPQDGWVEHNPEAIWDTVYDTLSEAYAWAQNQQYDIAVIGITNQRETTVVWDRKTGKPIYNAIVWQDRRTAQICRDLKADYSEADISAKTGLLLDPYFSATKAAWILDNVKGARARTHRAEFAFGTIDSFLIWRLTEGRVHATDATNASRTNLFNIHTQYWDPDLLDIFDIPANILPEVLDCADDFGICELFETPIPIRGVAGDQQAAAIGQACFEKGDIKSTYGTGCFVILNTGKKVVESNNRLLSTVCYRLNGKTTYALEGSIFMAGASVQWLRDGIKIIDSAAETEAICAKLDSNHGVYLVPAFTGLGAPHWDPDARGAIFGLTRDTGRAEFVRATVESVVYQTYDLLRAMGEDGVAPKGLRVDGGMVANSWMVQYLADVLNIPVDRPKALETTALGAAYLAGLGIGLFADLTEIADHWQADQSFTPNMKEDARVQALAGWHRAIGRVVAEK